MGLVAHGGTYASRPGIILRHDRSSILTKRAGYLLSCPLSFRSGRATR